MTAFFAYWRDPFTCTAPMMRECSTDQTLGAIVDGFDELKPYAFRQNGRIVVMGDDGAQFTIPPDNWDHVRIKENQSVAFQVTLHEPVSATTKIVGLISQVGSIIAPGLPGLGIAAGSLPAFLLTGGILAANLLLTLSRPPVTLGQTSTDQQSQSGPASINGNVIQAGAAIPRVLGTRRIFPPFATQPFTYYDGEDEFAEAVLILAGPHDISDVRVDDTLIEDAQDIEFEIRSGALNDDQMTLFNRYAVTNVPRLEMSQHQTDKDDTAGTKLLDQSNPENSLPVWHQFRMKSGDEYRIDILFEGLYDPATPSAVQGVPFRLRFRETSADSWVNGPEIHFEGKDPRKLRGTIIISWDDDFETRKNPRLQEGWTAAYQETAFWSAHSDFDGGAASPYYRDNAYATNVRRVQLDGDDCYIHLNTATLAKGPLQVEIIRGLCYNNLAKATYLFGGVSRDPFDYITGPPATIFRAQGELAHTAYVLRTAAVTNSHPINGGRPGSGLAAIAVKVRNREIRQISCEASGRVNNWNGTNWDTIEATSNPAAHFRDVLVGPLSPDPLPDALMDFTSIEDWHDVCETEGFTCDLVVEGASIEEVRRILAACGYAQPYNSDKWGVIRDYDRSAEEATQMFTARNSSSVSLSLAFDRLPDALRVKYIDSNNEDVETEKIIWNPDVGPVALPRYEEIQYRGLVTEADITARAEYDLRQPVARNAFWSFKTSAEAMVCRRGDLIALNHDLLDRTYFSARIASVKINASSLIQGVYLDQAITVWNEGDVTDVDDMTDILDVSEIGLQTAAMIRQTDGTLVTKALTGSTGEALYIEFATPFTNSLTINGDPLVRTGNLISIGKLGSVAERLIVIDPKDDGDGNYTLTCVPEAPELFT